MKKLITTISILAVLLVFGHIPNAFGLEDSTSNSLFKIGRSKDANEIYYEVNTTPDGSLDRKEPINIYWIKYAENNVVQPLTIVQQKFAYGLKFLEVTPEKAEFQFVSYSKRTLSLRKNINGKYAVFTEVEGKQVEMDRVFIQIEGGTFWFPKITRVEIHAKNAEENETVVEVIRP
jgi:hypothetical protein